MGYSESQMLGFVEMVEGLLVKERDALIKANLDADSMHEELLAKHRKANASNEEQEKKKREQKESTERHKVDLKELYVLASSQLDMMIGAVAKNSIAAKNFRRIRSRLKHTDRDNIEVQPVPTPAKP